MAEAEVIIAYRYVTAAIVGRWRESRSEAEEDAVRARLAIREGEELVWRVAGRIEEDDEAAAAPRG